MKVQSIIRVAVGQYEVRVFTEQRETLGITDIEIAVHREQDLSMMQLAEKLLENKTILAVEIIGWDRNGVRVER